MTDHENTFAKHQIRDRVCTPNFGSWRMMRKEDGQWSSTFWCRITAADGLLRVDGDFDGITFRGHLSHKDDPIARVAWMGAREGLDHYVIEKARLGSGRDACTHWDVDQARADLDTLIQEKIHELQQDEQSDPGHEDDWVPPSQHPFVLAATEGRDAYTGFDGREGVHELLNAIYTSGHDIDMEDFDHVGKSPSLALVLAHCAVQRLHELLTAEQAECPVPQPPELGLPQLIKAAENEMRRIDNLAPNSPEDAAGQRDTVRALSDALAKLREARSMHTYFVVGEQLPAEQR